MTQVDGPTGPRPGALRIYLGAAPGVGKTFAMLNEGHRRRERGTDVVVGFVETHGRARTAEQIGDLEVVPRRRAMEHRGIVLAEMDVDAILRRRPDLVLIDELAHTNVPGSCHDKRWQDIQAILTAGIDVISTVNIQHLESLNDVVERITGIRQRDTVPDHAVRAADQIELVDMAPEALRRRLAHGNVYGPDEIDAALGNYFRPGNLSALRELALLWVADRVDDAMHEYRDRHGITRPWETRERVIVALAGAPSTDHLVRRAARIAERAKGELIGVHVMADTGLSIGDEASAQRMAAQRRLVEALGGEYRRINSNDVAGGLVDLARSENATQIVLGVTARPRWQEMFSGSIINRVIRLSGPIDVHVISRPAAPDENGERGLPVMKPVLTPLSPQRQMWGWAIAIVGLPLIALAFSQLRDTFGLTSVLLLYLVLAMVVALVGGALPAVVAVTGGFVLANWYFTPPFHQLTIAHGENVLALVVYVFAAGTVAVLVDRVGRSRRRAARSQAEAEALAALAGSLTRPGTVAEMVDQLRITFGARSAALLARESTSWRTLVSSGIDPPGDPQQADVSRDVGDNVVLALAGRSMSSEDQRVLNAFAAHLAAAAESARLQTEAAKASDLAAANTLRGSLLQAVSHDLRTPLASIKASISSLRQRDIAWAPGDIDVFQRTIEEETDRLTDLVDNLLDMSRLQASALVVALRPTSVEETVLAAVASLGSAGSRVELDVPVSLPDVSADPALLTRALANLVGNALRHASGVCPPRIAAGEILHEGTPRVAIRIIDRGPGIRPADRELVFQPFQRLVDHHADGTGVGLGLAIARGFVDSMGGELTLDDTPGGGVTMVVELPVAPTRSIT